MRRQAERAAGLLFRRLTQRHERELIKEYTERQHKLASTTVCQPHLVKKRTEVERTPTNMRLSLPICPFLLRDLAAQVPSVEHAGHRHLCEREVGVSKCDVVQSTVGHHGSCLRVGK